MEGIKHKTVSVNELNMHIAEQGEGPLVLFLHGFPQLWYTWRHQIPFMASRGYRAVAPDLRGYGDTTGANNDDSSKFSIVHIVGDVVALLDAIAPGEKVFVVGHDMGAYVAWYFALFRPDRIKAMINFSHPFMPWNPLGSTVDLILAAYGKDHYVVRFQEPGEIEAEFEALGTRTFLRRIISYHSPEPILLPKGGGGFLDSNAPVVLPPWITEEDLDYYTAKFEQTGFTGAFNYYRSLDLFWELTRAWSGAKVIVPTKFIAGELSFHYNISSVKEYVQNGGMKKDVPLLEEVIVVEGGGHFIYEERPHEINNIIYDFFQKF